MLQQVINLTNGEKYVILKQYLILKKGDKTMENQILQVVNEAEIKKNICTRKGTLKTSPYNLNGLEKYIWRMIRFHSGKDLTMPIMCFFDLQNWIEAQGFKMDVINVCGIINNEGKALLDYLDKLVDKFSIELKLNPFKACSVWHKAGLF